MEKVTQYIGLFITGLLTVMGIVVDNGLRWRSEMEYREYDRQTRLLENIMGVSSVPERTALIQFYLSLGAFNPPIKDSMEAYVKASISNQKPEPKVALPKLQQPTLPKIVPAQSIPKPSLDVFNNAELSNGLRSLRQNELQTTDD